MGRSFYLTNNWSALRNASQAFSDKISLSPTSYGLTAPQALSYKTLNDDYVEKFVLADDPQTRTKGKLLSRDAAAVLLKSKASELAKIIEATPTVTDEQKYDLGLAVRGTPGPAPAPGTPSNLKSELLGDGSLKMKWRANNPSGLSGVTYQVYRRLSDAGEFTFLLATGEKSCVDSTIPKGTVQAQYQIRGIRPTAAGGWAQFVVNFAKDTSGVLATQVTTATAVKLAA